MKSLIGRVVETKDTKKIGKIVDEDIELNRYQVIFESGSVHYYYRTEIRLKRNPEIKIEINIEPQRENIRLVEKYTESGSELILSDDDFFGSIPEMETESKSESKIETKTEIKPSYAHKRITIKRRVNGTKSYFIDSRNKRFNSWHKKCQFRIVKTNFKNAIRP